MQEYLAYVLVAFAFLRMTLSSNDICIPTLPNTVHFFIASTRNQTGHWNVLLRMDHGAARRDKEHEETGLWEADVNHSVAQCEDGETINIVANIKVPPRRSLPGYELISGFGYYKLHTTPKTWDEAREICSQEGGYLATANSEKEMWAFQGILNRHPKFSDTVANDVTYLGFYDLSGRGQYVTLFGETLQEAGFARFAAGQPSGGELCGCFVRNQDLHDCTCHHVLSFLCEQGL